MIFKNNKTFDVLKWLCMVFIPAAAACYSQLAKVLGWAFGSEVAEVATILCTFLGALLGISNIQYYRQYPKTPDSVYELDDYDVEETEGEEGNG